MCETVQPDLMMMSDGCSIVPDNMAVSFLFVCETLLVLYNYFTHIMWLVARQPKTNFNGLSGDIWLLGTFLKY